MNRLLIGKFCLVMVMLQLICFLFVTNFMVKDEISDRKPFFAQIDEIAVSDSNVYTLDSTFKKICKYDLNGKFLYTISFSTTGSSRIFCDDENRLCRFDIRSHSVDVYDESGSVVDSYSIQYADIIKSGSLRSYDPEREIEKNGITYHFVNRIIKNSLLYFGDNSVVVESIGYHLFATVYRLIAIGAVGFAFYSIVSEYIKKFKAKQES